MHKTLLLICLLFSCYAFTQKKKYLRTELLFSSHNDAFLLQKKDAYYTNGLYFQYRSADRLSSKKKIHVAEIGQMIFTPLSKKGRTAADIDRPYCGYLFARYGQLIAINQESILQWNTSLGVVGSASLAENLQNEYHRLLGFLRFQGWEYQVRNALGLDADISYSFTAVDYNDLLKIVPQVQASIGTTFTHAKAGVYILAGNFEKNNNSALFNSRVSNGSASPQKKMELFVFAYPSITAQAYNATLQGGLLNKGSGAILADPRPFVFEQRYGICYAQDRLSIKLELVYQSKETDSQIRSHAYGAIQIAYRMF